MVSYDPESGRYMPIGFGYPKAGGIEIQVQILPKPGSAGEKDVRGALLMLAYKLVPEKIAAAIGFENPYPLLRVARVGDDGTPRYEERGEAYVRDQVSRAKRILLLVHGFTGDTRDMVASTRTLYQDAPDSPVYDLIRLYAPKRVTRSAHFSSPIANSPFSVHLPRTPYRERRTVVLSALLTTLRRLFSC